MYRILNWASLLLLIALGACGHLPFVTPAPRITSGPAEFPGILQQAAELGRRDVSVFVSHGMGNTSSCFADQVATLLDGHARPSKVCSADGAWIPVCLGTSFAVEGEALPRSGKHYGSACASVEQVPGTPIKISQFGQLRIVDTVADYAGKRFNVRVYGFWWNEDALTLQKPFIKDDLEVGLADRTAINRIIKRETINYGFSDAVLYVGSFGGVMRTGMRSALCLMALDALRPAGRALGTTHPSSPCEILAATPDATGAFAARHGALLSLSLGSRILFDALDNGDPGQPGAKAIDRLAEVLPANSPIVYMAANQLPLLGIGQLRVSPHREPLVAGKAALEPYLRRHLNWRQGDDNGYRNEDRGGNLIVAFHDPNDLLGYRAGRHMTGLERERIVEVQQYYATRWFFFANPVAAHAQTYSDRTGSRMVRCGAVQRGRKLVVREPC
jgi:hypothetical protein